MHVQEIEPGKQTEKFLAKSLWHALLIITVYALELHDYYMILYAYLKDSWRLQRSPMCAAWGWSALKFSYISGRITNCLTSAHRAHLGTSGHWNAPRNAMQRHATPKAATGPWATPSAPLLICKVASSSAQSCTIQGSLHPSSPSWNGWTCDTPFLRPRSAKYNVSGKEMQGSIAQMPLKHWNRFEPIWTDLNRLKPTGETEGRTVGS